MHLNVSGVNCKVAGQHHTASPLCRDALRARVSVAFSYRGLLLHRTETRTSSSILNKRICSSKIQNVGRASTEDEVFFSCVEKGP